MLNLFLAREARSPIKLLEYHVCLMCDFVDSVSSLFALVQRNLAP